MSQVPNFVFVEAPTPFIQEKNILYVEKLDEEAKIPTRGSEYSAGYDLYALEAGVVPAGDKKIIKTGIAIRLPILDFPYKVYGSIRSRSGLSVKHDLEVGAGVIDFDYSNEVCVILRNFGRTDFVYDKHFRVAQLVLELHYLTDEVRDVKKLPSIRSNRNGGFGSTGY